MELFYVTHADMFFFHGHATVFQVPTSSLDPLRMRYAHDDPILVLQAEFRVERV